MRSRCCLCVCLCIPPIVAKQRLGRNVNAVTNTHATIEELLDSSFSMWPVSYRGKQFFPERLVFKFVEIDRGNIEFGGEVTELTLLLRRLSVVDTHRHAHRQDGDVISLLYSLRKEHGQRHSFERVSDTLIMKWRYRMFFWFPYVILK
jgi:hypothetical protein